MAWDSEFEDPGPSEPQRQFLTDLASELGVDLLSEASEVLGYQVTHLNSLDRSTASELIEALKEKRKERGDEYRRRYW